MKKKYKIEIEGDLCVISWNGFNIYGDQKSRDEVSRLMHLEDRLAWFEQEYKERANELSRRQQDKEDQERRHPA